MAAMTIHLRDDLRDFVEREVASGRFGSIDEVIEEALEKQAGTPGLVIEPTMTVQEAVAEALAQVERGETEPYTDSFMRESRERALANGRRGHKVRDEIRY